MRSRAGPSSGLEEDVWGSNGVRWPLPSLTRALSRSVARSLAARGAAGKNSAKLAPAGRLIARRCEIYRFIRPPTIISRAGDAESHHAWAPMSLVAASWLGIITRASAVAFTSQRDKALVDKGRAGRASQWTWTAPQSGNALQMAPGQLKMNLCRNDVPMMILCRRWQMRGRGRRDKAGRTFVSSQSEVESLGMAKEGARLWRSRAIVSLNLNRLVLILLQAASPCDWPERPKAVRQKSLNWH